MPRPPRDVTDAELSVLQHLWDAGAASVRELADRLYPGGAASEYATVQKLLDRLEAKGCVRRIELDASPRRFTAAVAREDLIDRRLRAMADQLCGGSLLPLVNQLARSHSLTVSQRRKLRRLIDESADRQSRRPRR